MLAKSPQRLNREKLAIALSNGQFKQCVGSLTRGYNTRCFLGVAYTVMGFIVIKDAFSGQSSVLSGGLDIEMELDKFYGKLNRPKIIADNDQACLPFPVMADKLLEGHYDMPTPSTVSA